MNIVEDCEDTKAAADQRSLAVRDAGPNELDEIAEVMLVAYAEYEEILPAAARAAWEAYRRDVADVQGRLNDAELMVAEGEGRIVGAVTFYGPGMGSDRHPWPAGWAGIRLLAVLPEARRLGIGRELTLECLRRARSAGARSVGLYTMEFMAVARAMYERMGFRRVPELDFRSVPELNTMAYRLEL